jgi:hypothetical protein
MLFGALVLFDNTEQQGIKGIMSSYSYLDKATMHERGCHKTSLVLLQ